MTVERDRQGGLMFTPAVGGLGDGSASKAISGTRVCACPCGCRTKLQPYNKDTYCSLCQERSRKAGSACGRVKASSRSKVKKT